MVMNGNDRHGAVEYRLPQYIRRSDDAGVYAAHSRQLFLNDLISGIEMKNPETLAVCHRFLFHVISDVADHVCLGLDRLAFGDVPDFHELKVHDNHLELSHNPDSECCEASS